ncbi:hypothetical protein AAE478_004807 [Parahypoxylon ruwenzoriense]
MPPALKAVGTRNKKNTASSSEAGGRQSAMSVRSFAAFERDDIEEGNDGASIVDILKRRSSFGISIAETVASPLTFKKIWEETANIAFSDGQLGKSRRPNSTQSDPEHGRTGIITKTGSGDAQYAETRSPSSPPKSPFSLSTVSKEDSSSSSIPPTHSEVLSGLQSQGLAEHDELKPLASKEIDPASFNLVAPPNGQTHQYSLETRSEALFSEDHLRVIFDNLLLLERFISFIYASRPTSIPLLVYYLNVLKASKAISYANAITRSLVHVKGLEFSEETIPCMTNGLLLEEANKTFQTLAREDLPAYITHTWTQKVSATIQKLITDTLPAYLKNLSEGLGEVFCLTDPSRPDNPIIFASEEFYKTTQYGVNYALGRNCRFLQGPKTNSSSLRRIREHLEAGKEHCEVLLNYRRDGSPFMNLLTVAPLIDSRGVVRYHIGAQIDVSSLAKECAGLESLKQLVSREHRESIPSNSEDDEVGVCEGTMDEFCELAEMFNQQELSRLRVIGNAPNRTDQEETGEAETSRAKPGAMITDGAGAKRLDTELGLNVLASSGCRLAGVFEHYLLVRPYPSLRVLFASPSLRIPGMLQSSFMARVGGSQTVRGAIAQTLTDGHGVTARIRWLTRTDTNGKFRWIQCTPLIGANGAVGVWMVVIVDDETGAALGRHRGAPPVGAHIGGRMPFDNEQPVNASRVAFDDPRPPSIPRQASETGGSLDADATVC